MEPVWTMPYELTRKEAARGMALACKPIYSGRWRALQIAIALLMGAGVATLGMIIAVLLEKSLGLSTGWFGVFALALWVVYVAVARGTRQRIAAAYVDSPMMDGQQLELSARGITTSNGRSDGGIAWTDVVAVVETKDMLVASIGASGFILPSRVLEQAGDAGVIRQQVQAWQVAATGDVA
ncbi:hypothetical protein GGQ68_003238 [Sagittula marina]|uniref:YcxB-like C-terminal domain-containing protein n=2 Tax=Sagittula marina TaxID=943940 RepID=A0A7W6DX66_9RHOB|nr:hypothetical protein [Sagittula marina]